VAVGSARRETGLYGRKLDTQIAALADAQHGVVSLAQLRRLGLSDTAVQKRAARGLLHRVHRAVYAVGRRGLSVDGRFAAAVMACGTGAVLSHRSGADRHGILGGALQAPDVTVPSGAGAGHARGIIVHRSTTLVDADVTRLRGIPCTTVARTLLDLADVVAERQLRSAIEAAERLRLYDDRNVKAVIARGGARPAASRLRRAVAAYEEPDMSRTELERRALALFASGGLPRPRVNSYVETASGPLEVDFFWPDRGLVVEADSYRWHSARRDFENDRERDQLLHAVGVAVLRVTWRQVLRGGERVLEALRSVQ
jgi:predicted transcriptional regulator of viral defense system